MIFGCIINGVLLRTLASDRVGHRLDGKQAFDGFLRRGKLRLRSCYVGTLHPVEKWIWLAAAIAVCIAGDIIIWEGEHDWLILVCCTELCIAIKTWSNQGNFFRTNHVDEPGDVWLGSAGLSGR